MRAITPAASYHGKFSKTQAYGLSIQTMLTYGQFINGGDSMISDYLFQGGMG